ncbi:MAG: hypothetical protein AMJ46_13330 [Latescibacteria bacterium DG_63]|nr:MAG: hypothetical protein AMJ46_13330 [Latescibacteria bacterium DG_63]
MSYTELLGLFSGSAIYCHSVTGESVIEGFTIAHSYAGGGGAISCAVSSLTICDNVIFDCSASGIEGQDGAGGAIYVHLSSAIIRGNTIYDCRVGTGGTGGSIYLSSSPDVTIEENIIAFCTGEAIHSYTDVPVILCNDVWGNTPTNYGGIIPDQTGTNGNLSMDPLFCDALNEDFTLHADSPCLDAPGCGLIGAFAQG